MVSLVYELYQEFSGEVKGDITKVKQWQNWIMVGYQENIHIRRRKLPFIARTVLHPHAAYDGRLRWSENHTCTLQRAMETLFL